MASVVEVVEEGLADLLRCPVTAVGGVGHPVRVASEEGGGASSES